MPNDVQYLKTGVNYRHVSVPRGVQHLELALYLQMRVSSASETGFNYIITRGHVSGAWCSAFETDVNYGHVSCQCHMVFSI